jgi:long-chain acyl-CoA synthetase
MSTGATSQLTDLVTMYQRSVQAYGPKPCYGIKKGATWSWLTYADVGAAVDKLRGGLVSLGVAKGDPVAVISNNRIEWAVGCYATYGAGAVWVAMYEAQLDKEWKFILADCGAKVVFAATRAIADRLHKLKGELPALQHVICFEGTGEGTYEGLLERGAKAPSPMVAVAPGDIANIIYTSGTTGNPKGVELSHQNLVFGVQKIHEVAPFTSEDRSLAFLPWAHVVGGCIELHGMFSLGAQAAICEQVDQIVASLAEVQPTVLLAVPRIWNKIYDGVQKQIAGKPAPIRAIFAAGMRARSKQKRGQPTSLWEKIALALAKKLIFSKIIAKFGGRLKFAISGAAALSKEVGEFIDNLGVVVYEGYGLSECCGIACANRPGGQRIGSVGQALPGMRIELDKTVAGSDADNGEIIIVGPSVMKGYHNLPAQSAEVLTAQGGLRTGDLGRLDAEGYLYITGRCKELYKLENGKYVAPAPIEEQLTLSPYIGQVMLHGQDKPFNVALIVADPVTIKQWAAENNVSGDPMTCDQTRALIAAEIEKFSADIKGYERVKKFVLASEELSTANDMLTPTLKVKRRNVVAKYGAALDALYK